MKFPKGTEFFVMYAVSLRVAELRDRYRLLASAKEDFSDNSVIPSLVSSILDELMRLDKFLSVNGYPTF